MGRCTALHLHPKGLLLKAQGPSSQAAIGLQGKRGAFKNHLVLPTHQVGKHQPETGVSRTDGHGSLTLERFAGVKGGSVDDGEQLRTGRTAQASRLVKPGVFADQQPHFEGVLTLAHRKNARGLTGREIAPLVKHLIVGQLPLRIGVQPAPLADHMGRIEELRHGDAASAQTDGGLGWAANHHMQTLEIGQFSGHLIHRGFASLKECGPQEQIFSSVAADGQFGGKHQTAARLISLTGGGNDLASIARHVTDTVVQLGDANLE